MDNEPVGLARGLTQYGDADFAVYLRRSFANSTGLSAELLRKPVVGIASTYSEFNNCHRLVPELVTAVKRGVLAAGGLVFLGIANLYLIGARELAVRQALIAAGGVLALAVFWRVRVRYLGVLTWLTYAGAVLLLDAVLAGAPA